MLLYTVVSRVSAHGRSTYNSKFLAYRALARDTGRLPCAKIKVDGAYCSAYACACYMACTLVRAHAMLTFRCWFRSIIALLV